MNSERLKPVWAAARHQDVDHSNVDISVVCATISCLINYDDRRIRHPSLHKAADLVYGTGRLYSQQVDKLCEDTSELLKNVGRRHPRLYDDASSDTGSATRRNDNRDEFSLESPKTPRMLSISDENTEEDNSEMAQADESSKFASKFTQTSRRNDDRDEVPLGSPKRPRMLSISDEYPEEDNIEMAQADESSRLASKFTQTSKSAVQNENYKRLLRRRGNDINLDDTLPLAIALVFDTNSRLPIKTIISNVHPDIRKL